MSDDGEKQVKSVAEALAESAEAANEDATLQISKAELAAIRQSASDGSMTPEMLREINRRRDEQPEEDEETQSFDRDKLSDILNPKPAPDGIADRMLAGAALEQSMEDDSPDSSDFVLAEDEVEDAGQGLDELSDADLHAVVFGDQHPTTAKKPGEAPSSKEALEPIEDPLPETDFGGLDELSDADLHAVIFGDSDEPGVEEFDPADVSDLDLLDDPEFESLEELTADDPAQDELDEAVAPSTTRAPSAHQPPARAGRPPARPSARPPSRLAQPPSPHMDDDLVEDFRGAESRLLSMGAGLSSLVMIASGVLRLATSERLTFLHPVVAAMMVTVGVLILMGMLVSFLQRR